MARFVSRSGSIRKNHVLSGADAIGRSVPMQSLDRALFGNGRVPILIKMDVEGHETEVFRGARAVLGEPGLKAILSESRSPDVVEMLRSVGMIEFAYDAFARRLVPANEVPMANALFLRDPDQVARRVSQAQSFRILDTMV